MVKALHLNALQVSRYISTYSTVSSDIPRHQMALLQSELQEAESELQTLVTLAVTDANSQSPLLPRFVALKNKYLRYLSKVWIYYPPSLTFQYLFHLV